VFSGNRTAPLCFAAKTPKIDFQGIPAPDSLDGVTKCYSTYSLQNIGNFKAHKDQIKTKARIFARSRTEFRAKEKPASP